MWIMGVPSLLGSWNSGAGHWANPACPFLGQDCHQFLQGLQCLLFYFPPSSWLPLHYSWPHFNLVGICSSLCYFMSFPLSERDTHRKCARRRYTAQGIFPARNHTWDLRRDPETGPSSTAEALMPLLVTTPAQGWSFSWFLTANINCVYFSTLCKSNHTLCILLYLTPFIQYCNCNIYLSCWVYLSGFVPFLLPNRIPLLG